jgi:hypothetical protein
MPRGRDRNGFRAGDGEKLEQVRRLALRALAVVFALAVVKGETRWTRLLWACRQTMRLANKSSVFDSYTDRSGTITLGGTSQQLAPKNADRFYFFFQNISTGDLWLNYTTVAGIGTSGSELVRPGDKVYLEASYVTSEAINVIGATTGQQFTCKENNPSPGSTGAQI